MKKKQFISKLQFQKTTIVSFNAIKNINGGQLINVDTEPISINGLTCQTLLDCQTKDNQYTCLSCEDNGCPRPTRPTSASPNCGAGDVTKFGCFETRDVC